MSQTPAPHHHPDAFDPSMPMTAPFIPIADIPEEELTDFPENAHDDSSLAGEDEVPTTMTAPIMPIAD
jgi:hypothetical protein